MSKVETPIGSIDLPVDVAAAEDVVLDDGAKLFQKDVPVLVEKPLPVSSLSFLTTEFQCPEMDPDIEITVNNYISFDGGLTWIFNGGFARIKGGPWIGKDGKPTISCSSWTMGQENGALAKLPDGTLIRSEVKTNKDVPTGKILHTVLTEAPAK